MTQGSIGRAGIGRPLTLGAAILRGASLWGAADSHGLALIGMGFVRPVFFGHP